jgi:hypothetical protein
VESFPINADAWPKISTATFHLLLAHDVDAAALQQR